MDRFLQNKDALGELIQAGAAELYQRLQKLNVETLGLPHHCLHYYQSSHSRRLFFSIETSAHLLYRSIHLCGRPVNEIVLMDYGAGVGTLYLLARLVGCKKVIYSDHLEDWRRSAQLISEAVGVDIDEYIVGDIDVCLDRLDEMNVQCDIITSRNVIEHIYKLDVFYRSVSVRQPGSVVYSSTTANHKNPASVLKHLLWHRKWEKIYLGQRIALIERQSPGLSVQEKHVLAKATRGLAVNDFQSALVDFRKSGRLPNPALNGSNTCDPATGVWAEHLLATDQYRELIGENSFTVSFAPGFWDTHYENRMMNWTGSLLNRLIAKGGSVAMKMSPFIYVIAVPIPRN